MEKHEQIHPLKTKLTFNVSITGHRNLPNADSDLLSKQANTVLGRIAAIAKRVQAENRDSFSADPAELRVMSMLADGADRILTQCGLELGYHFQCALPMRREEYEMDFETAESREEFDRLLGKAERVLTIEACSSVRSRAYQDCGHVLLCQSDILIAVWDGKDSGKVGGTSDLFAFASRNNIPVIWIDAAAEHHIQFVYDGKSESDWEPKLEQTVTDLLCPWGNDRQNKKSYDDYRMECLSKSSHAKLYQHFIDFILRKFKKGSNLPKKEVQSNKFYAENYAEYYAASDKLAIFYRDIYRSCGILRQLLPFLASIGLALGFYAVLFGGPTKLSDAKAGMLNMISNIGFLVQAVCFLMIILLSKVEKKFHWHQKFRDYRKLSELIRQMEYLAPMGLIVKSLRPALSQGMKISWVNAQFRAIVRQAGLPNARIGPLFLKEHTLLLNLTIVQEQIEYHKLNASRMSIVSKRLERFGLIVYYVGILIIVLRVAEHTLVTGSEFSTLNSYQSGYISTFFNMLCMVIPLFSALAFGISTQEGFDHIYRLSESMKENLFSLQYMIAGERDADFNHYMRSSQHCAEIMLFEFVDWDILIRSKDISDH